MSPFPSRVKLRLHHVTFFGKKHDGELRKKRWTEKNIWIWKLPPVSPAAPFFFLDSRHWRQAISLVHIWLKQPSGAHPPEFSRNLKDVGVGFPTTILQGGPRADRYKWSYNYPSKTLHMEVKIFIYKGWGPTLCKCWIFEVYPWISAFFCQEWLPQQTTKVVSQSFLSVFRGKMAQRFRECMFQQLF